MKIPAPNYTNTPNIFFDEIMKTLNEGEMRVLLIIIRQTFGWHKCEDWITLSMLAQKTGYERRSVCKILIRLIQKNLIFKRIVGSNGNQKCYYGLVTETDEREIHDPSDGIETEEEMACFKNSYTSVPSDTPPVSHRTPPPVSHGTPTKENIYTKETTTKEKAASPIAAVSSEKKQQQKAVYGCLESLQIDPYEKQWITTHYSEDDVKNAVAWALHPETKHTKGLIQALKWACKQKLVPPLSKDDEESINKKAAAEIIQKAKKPSFLGIDILAKGVEFIFYTSQKAPDFLKYTEKGFTERLKDKMKMYQCQIA